MAHYLRAPSFSGHFLLLVTAAFLASACHPRVSDPHNPNFIVAEKDNWTITRSQLDQNVNGFLQQRQVTAAQVGPERLPMLETMVVRDMVLEKLLLARAATHQFPDIDKDDATALERLKGRFPNEQAFQDKLKQAGVNEDELKKRIHEQDLIEKTLQAEAVHDVDPTDKEINDFYLSHQNLFEVPLKLRASRVIVLVDEKATPAEKEAKKKKINQAHARVAKGEDISKVAMEDSEDRYSAPKGGDVGYFQRGENEAQFDDVAFASKVGVLSPVFESPMGYQFLKVTEIKPAGTLPIADVRASIAQELHQLKTAQEEKDYTDKLLKDSGVKYYIPLVEPPAAPPTPTGAPAGTPVPLPPADNSDSSAPPPADSTGAPPTAPGT
jgi:parvulin-like peptidyl-prolyl isomerase